MMEKPSVKLDTPLEVHEIDFRIQSINKGGYATILAYKDARVDMNRLDAVYGPEFWQRKHEVINGQLFCSIGIYNKEIKEWVWKQDVGVESNTEAEKGRASDSFKRACFNLGIGRGLYDFPDISVKLNADEFTVDGNKVKATWNLKLKEWSWALKYRDDGSVMGLAAKDENDNVRFKYGTFKENG